MPVNVACLSPHVSLVCVSVAWVRCTAPWPSLSSWRSCLLSTVWSTWSEFPSQHNAPHQQPTDRGCADICMGHSVDLSSCFLFPYPLSSLRFTSPRSVFARLSSHLLPSAPLFSLENSMMGDTGAEDLAKIITSLSSLQILK